MFGHLSRDRQDMIRGYRREEPIRRSEYIDRNGQQAWLDYTKKHGLPEGHALADAHIHKLSSISK